MDAMGHVQLEEPYFGKVAITMMKPSRILPSKEFQVHVFFRGFCGHKGVIETTFQ